MNNASLTASTNTELTLVVMAAGGGRRFGGLKQLAPVGPGGETLMEYSIHDALAAQFSKIAIVIRRETQSEFQQKFGSNLMMNSNVGFAFQDADVSVPDSARPIKREKPWGTAHAVLSARHLIHGPFAVINADDFYGASSFEMMGRFLRSKGETDPMHGAMVGFHLKNTLSDHGPVSRGICKFDEQRHLIQVIERHKIVHTVNGCLLIDDDGDETRMPDDALVSMNLWGFPKAFLGHFEQRFHRFLEQAPAPTQEFEIPGNVQHAIDSGELQISVLKTDERWCGLTYREDLPIVCNRIQSLIATSNYPRQLNFTNNAR